MPDSPSAMDLIELIESMEERDSTPIAQPSEPAPQLAASLDEARKLFFSELDRGTCCVLCGRHAKRYKRKLNSGMARMLIHLYRMSTDLPAEQDGWMHVSHVFLGLGRNAVAQEYSKLRFWSLLEERPNDNPEIPGSGYWRVTSLGASFAQGHVSVPRHVYVYDNVCTGVSEERTTIQDALGDKFNYEELMAS